MIQLYQEVIKMEDSILQIAELIELDTEVELEKMAQEILEEQKKDA